MPKYDIRVSTEFEVDPLHLAQYASNRLEGSDDFPVEVESVTYNPEPNPALAIATFHRRCEALDRRIWLQPLLVQLEHLYSNPSCGFYTKHNHI